MHRNTMPNLLLAISLMVCSFCDDFQRESDKLGTEMIGEVRGGIANLNLKKGGM